MRKRKRDAGEPNSQPPPSDSTNDGAGVPLTTDCQKAGPTARVVSMRWLPTADAGGLAVATVTGGGSVNVAGGGVAPFSGGGSVVVVGVLVMVDVAGGVVVVVVVV